MKYFLLLFLIISAVLNFTFPQSVQDLIKEGDKETEQFNNKKALELYLKADQQDANNWEVLWRISRAYVDIAEHMPSSNGEQEDAQLAVYEKALDYADRSVKLANDKSITYIRRAVANGRIALFKGVFTVSGVVNKVKEDCEFAIKLGNGDKYVQALAHFILGRTHAKISEKWAPARAVIGLGWADIETAIKEFRKAIELYPNFRMFYLELAKAYIGEDEFSKARDNLKKVISSPEKDEDDDLYLEEAKKLLEEIKNE
jgi:tetratricopeptide (TPR) repeat protein